MTRVALLTAVALAPFAALAQSPPTAISPGSGSATDATGNVWAISPSGSIQENGHWVAGGGGTAALVIVGDTVYGLDDHGEGWFTFGAEAQAWASSAAPAGVVTPTTASAVSSAIVQATTADVSPSSPASTTAALARFGCGSTVKAGTYFGILPLQQGGEGRIVAPDGKVFVPRGVNVMQGQEPSVSALQANFPGINFVRYANYQFSSPDQLAPWVNSLTQAGIVVEIEDHTASNGTVSGGSAGQVFTGQQLQHESDWYASVAAYFKSNPYVWFGTNNEPPEAGGSLSQWHLATYEAIRGTGNQTIIMIDPWGGYLTDGLDSSVYSQMSNVAWDVHYYGWASNFSTDQGTVNSALSSILSKVQALTSAGGVTMPIIIGEYGNSTTGYAIDANGTQTVDAVQQAVINAEAAGSSAWAYAAGNPGDGLIGGGGLSSYGQQVASYIAKAISGVDVCGNSEAPTQNAAAAHQAAVVQASSPTSGSGAPDGAQQPTSTKLPDEAVSANTTTQATSDAADVIIQNATSALAKVPAH